MNKFETSNGHIFLWCDSQVWTQFYPGILSVLKFKDYY